MKSFATRVGERVAEKKRDAAYKSSGLSGPLFRPTGTRWLGKYSLELVRLHIHAPPSKPHAFSFQAEALLQRRVPSQLDRATRSQHALPGQSKSAPQNRRDLPGRSRKSRRPSNRAVGRHLPTWNRANRPFDPQPHCTRRVIFLLCHPEQRGLTRKASQPAKSKDPCNYFSADT